MRNRRIAVLSRETISLIVLAFVLFPFIWLLASSLKSNHEVNMIPPTLVPHGVTFEAYGAVIAGNIREGSILGYLLNSFYVVIPATAVSTMLSLLGGYGFTRFRWFGRTALIGLVAFSNMVTGASMLLPMADLLQRLGLLNSLVGLSMVYVGISVPIGVWFALSSFLSVPKELEEAAQIDGCSTFRTLYSVFLPVLRMQIVTIGLMIFLELWGELPFALVLLQTQAKSTVPIIMAGFSSDLDISFNEIGATATLMSLPIMVLFFVAQKYFVRGMMEGSVKG